MEKSEQDAGCEEWWMSVWRKVSEERRPTWEGCKSEMVGATGEQPSMLLSPDCFFLLVNQLQLSRSLPLSLLSLDFSYLVCLLSLV